MLQELYAAFCEQTDHSIHALLRLVEAHPEYRVKMLENIAKTRNKLRLYRRETSWKRKKIILSGRGRKQSLTGLHSATD